MVTKHTSEKSINPTEKSKYYAQKLPIDSDSKRWLQKWWGRDEFFADRKTTFGLLLMSCLDYGQEPITAQQKMLDTYDDFITIWIPKDSYITERRMWLINETVDNMMIEQIVAVSCAKRHNLESPAAAVIEYYKREFDLQNTSADKLDKASQRLRAQRHIPRFVTRGRIYSVPKKH
jgi:hypothetical protein